MPSSGSLDRTQCRRRLASARRAGRGATRDDDQAGRLDPSSGPMTPPRRRRSRRQDRVPASATSRFDGQIATSPAPSVLSPVMPSVIHQQRFTAPARVARSAHRAHHAAGTDLAARSRSAPGRRAARTPSQRHAGAPGHIVHAGRSGSARSAGRTCRWMNGERCGAPGGRSHRLPAGESCNPSPRIFHQPAAGRAGWHRASPMSCGPIPACARPADRADGR